MLQLLAAAFCGCTKDKLISRISGVGIKRELGAKDRGVIVNGVYVFSKAPPALAVSNSHSPI